MINGAADYTICYFDKRLKTTHAHQLAASLVFYSPLQTISGMTTFFYHGEPEVEWFENCKRCLMIQSAERHTRQNITMARRKGQEWFLGR